MFEELTPLIEELKEDETVKGIAVFGSRARGKGRPDSDLDLAVLVDQPDYGRQDMKNAGFEVELWQHPLPAYERILNKEPDNDIAQALGTSCLLQIMRELQPLYDPDGILRRAQSTARKWKWSPLVKLKLEEALNGFREERRCREYVAPELEMWLTKREELIDWNIRRCKAGLPLLRRNKEIRLALQDTADLALSVRYGIYESFTREQVTKLFRVFEGIVRVCFTRGIRPWSEVMDTRKAWARKDLLHTLLSMDDATVFLISCFLRKRGATTAPDLKLFDSAVEGKLVEAAALDKRLSPFLLEIWQH